MPSREQIIEAFWAAVPADAGWPELAAGLTVEATVDGVAFTVETRAEGAFRSGPCDQFVLVLEEYAVAAAGAALMKGLVAA